MTGFRHSFASGSATGNLTATGGAAFSRRALLQRAASGFGAVALSALLCDDAFANSASPADPLAARPPHFRARAKRVIFLYMDGGPSQVDTFDPKPRLDREH